ncbi:MAG: hypothetical protein Q8L39_04830 [Burkholderiales bacterium]|nr:hypothetical protein [Burkholderiales bacterium]
MAKSSKQSNKTTPPAPPAAPVQAPPAASNTPPPAKGLDGGAPKKDKTVKVLRVIAKQQGFRRAGREFGTAATDIVLAELSDEHIQQLMSEPMLSCIEVEIESN